ncbi:glutamyl-tRNA reductase [Chthonomonas calidirosea]|uniref:Glutamyl-tRNA reductase n=1 Tax=Chthonomonas calidirosea (strain DSM 23976 / ICMP 18418 / T49) TaxID=1303518 RepID=S0EW20_CHTCT|nr:glutamyl-tRNA reductase [Chthonomonas calidirosea]CCW36048.1 glutamyl-tRNA reductase [Chthonomonas calidirosea T49]CEK18489.1 glutamyl-tRNA reductase [Chthonomonas calidirosea]
MPIVLVGMNHQSAPLALRERLSYQKHALPAAFKALSTASSVQECVILSTCNRVEVYAVGSVSPAQLCEELITHISRFHNVPATEFASLLYRKMEEEAVHHLLRVACSLDSMVIGEAQILGQVREALRTAQSVGAAGPLLSRLFEHALTAGKRVRTETEIGRGGFSIGHVAVELASRIFDDFTHAQILILGAGKMSELAARHLIQNGVRFVVVANRTYERARDMAHRLSGQAIHFEEAFETGLVQADIVISSTAAPHPILRKDNLLPIMRRRRGKPLFLIDIALPRDVAEDVNDLENVFVYNLDDLQAYLNEHIQNREAEIHRAEAIVDEERVRFLAWRKTREVTPAIGALRAHLEQIKQEYWQIFAPRLAHLPEKDRQTIRTMMDAMIDRVAKDPIQRLKTAALENTSDYDLPRALCELFGITAAEPSPSLPAHTTAPDIDADPDVTTLSAAPTEPER